MYFSCVKGQYVDSYHDPHNHPEHPYPRTSSVKLWNNYYKQLLFRWMHQSGQCRASELCHAHRHKCIQRKSVYQCDLRNRPAEDCKQRIQRIIHCFGIVTRFMYLPRYGCVLWLQLSHDSQSEQRHLGERQLRSVPGIPWLRFPDVRKSRKQNRGYT